MNKELKESIHKVAIDVVNSLKETIPMTSLQTGLATDIIETTMLLTHHIGKEDGNIELLQKLSNKSHIDYGSSGTLEPKKFVWLEDIEKTIKELKNS